MECYSSLAPYYDILMKDTDYDGYVKGVKNVFDEFNIPENGIVLDLGCGTGNITYGLAKLGYDMIGLDISENMLSVAAAKKPQDLSSNVLFIASDMCDFELYGTVDAIVSSFDCINYITNTDDLKKMFGLVKNYLNPGGIFLFDINSKYKFENIFANNDFILEEDGVFCGWQNSYNKKTHICRFDLDIFVSTKNGYDRLSETQYERMYSERYLKKVIEDSGLVLSNIFSSTYPIEDYSSDSERLYFVCKNEK